MDSMRTLCVQSVRAALAVLLMQMRLGLSCRALANLFHLKNEETVSRLIQQTHIELMKTLTTHHLDLKHIDHKTVLGW